MQRITSFERQVIEVGLRVGKRVRAIARSLDRDHRVIQREIHRNSGDYSPYTAVVAERISAEREARRHRCKLDKPENAALKKYVIENIRKDNSPEQVAGELKEQAPWHLRGQSICHETIYQYIYVGNGRWEHLWPNLRRKRRKRQKRHARKHRKTTIPSRISIHARPIHIQTKRQIGHWESDTLEGKRSTKHHISVQYERSSQSVLMRRIKDKSAPETKKAISSCIESTPKNLWRTITFDNGTETAMHAQLRDEYKVETFHCDAYASWQKGGVENINGLIRQYIPKGTDISKMTNKQIYAIQERLNNRPRKKLNYLTPNQVIAEKVGQ